MNASQMITLLEKKLKLRPSAKAMVERSAYLPTDTPTPNDDACPRCKVGIVFTLDSGTRWCMNCGEL